MAKTDHQSMVKQYLLWTRACSTLVVLSDRGVPAEFWLITERNFSSSLVLSVLPAPLSPLKMQHTEEKNPIQRVMTH